MSDDSASPSSYRSKQTDGATVVTILDSELLCDGRETFYALADQIGSDPEVTNVVLNLEELRVFKSMMLGVLINFQKRLKDQGKRLKISSVDPDVLRVFKLTKMDQIFDIQADEQAAIRSFDEKPAGLISRLWGAFGKSAE